MSYFLKYEDDDCIDLSEFEPRQRGFWCSDRMCGASDCGNCRPLTYDKNEPTDEHDEN